MISVFTYSVGPRTDLESIVLAFGKTDVDEPGVTYHGFFRLFTDFNMLLCSVFRMHPRGAERLAVYVADMDAFATAVVFFVMGAVFISSLWLLSHWWQRVKAAFLKAGHYITGDHPSSGLFPAVLGPLLHRYDYNELKLATGGFDVKHVLGKGGCGTVYKGQLGGTMVAVKRIYGASTRGRREFLAEATIIGRMRHRNLVPLLGWSAANKEFLLVYEYMPNGSLDKYLFRGSGEPINWQMRFNLLKGMASALAYLHEELEHRIVHRDVKSSNVMLDAELNPRLGDFGLARLYEHCNRSPQSTHPAGTLGYMPPECCITGKVTEKIDVFSYGVLALEVACGRRPIVVSRPTNEMALPDWVWKLYKENQLLKAADSRLEKGGGFNAKEMERVLLLGLLCTHANPKRRPSMREVGQILRLELPVPELPPDRPMLFCPGDSPIPLHSTRQQSPLTVLKPLPTIEQGIEEAS